jgi:hypothetical protein
MCHAVVTRDSLNMATYSQIHERITLPKFWKHDMKKDCWANLIPKLDRSEIWELGTCFMINNHETLFLLVRNVETN